MVKYRFLSIMSKGFCSLSKTIREKSRIKAIQQMEEFYGTKQSERRKDGRSIQG